MNHATLSSAAPSTGHYFATLARGFEDDDLDADGYYAGPRSPHDGDAEHWLARAVEATSAGTTGWSRGLATATLGASSGARRERLSVIEGRAGNHAGSPLATAPSRRPHPAFALHEELPRGWGLR